MSRARPGTSPQRGYLWPTGRLDHAFAQPLGYITQIAKAQGKASGIVSSLPLTHATPATFGGQNISRNNYGEIGKSMIIVLTDHGNALPMGPNPDVLAFEAIQNNGQGVLPGVNWHYNTHTNENTLLFADGAGSDLFDNEVVGIDPGLVHILRHNADGRYIENTGVYNVMEAAMVPEPETYALMLAGLGLVGFMARRRKSR